MVWKSPTKPATAPAANTGAPPPPTAAVPPPAAQAPAPLPPVQQAPAATPAPAAAEPRRSRRAAPAATAPAATPTPAASAPGPAATVVTAVATPIQQLPGFLAALTPRGAVRGAALIVANRSTAGEPNIFPTVYMSGGDTGGSMIAHDMNAEGSSVDLPLGKDPVKVILIGVRYELVIWPKAFQRGVKITPRSKAIIADDDADAVALACKAAERYTFRNRATQDQFDGVGHPTLAVELLVFDPQAGLYCMQTSGGYDSCFNTAKELVGAFPVVAPTPVEIQPFSYTTKGSKGQPGWLEHYYQIRQDANSPEMAPIKAAFNTFLNENGANPELNAAIAAWAKSTYTDDQMENLELASQIR